MAMSGDPSDRPYAGRFVDGEHRFSVRVYYEDTDAGGVVYHANYLRYFERARTDMLALIGADLGAVLGAGEGGYVVSAADLRFFRPARLGDALIITSRMAGIRQASCVVQQRVIRNEQVLVEGRLTVAFVGAEGRPRRQPAAWMEAFRAITGA